MGISFNVIMFNYEYYGNFFQFRTGGAIFLYGSAGFEKMIIENRPG